MLNAITTVSLWVRDQEEAKAFYTEKLGMEVREDVTVPELGNFRWVSVGLPGQDVSITLMAVPGPPVFDDETRAQIQEVLASTGTRSRRSAPRRRRACAPRACPRR